MLHTCNFWLHLDIFHTKRKLFGDVNIHVGYNFMGEDVLSLCDYGVVQRFSEVILVNYL